MQPLSLASLYNEVIQGLSSKPNIFLYSFYSLLSASKHREISQLKEKTFENTLAFICKNII